MIVRCDVVENYMFLRDSQLVKWLDCNKRNRGSSHELYVSIVFLTGARLNNLIAYSIVG